MNDKKYIGKLKSKTTQGGVPALKGFICVDDLNSFSSNIEKSNNGKSYIPIFIYPLITPDARGNTHSIIVDDNKKEDMVIDKQQRGEWNKNPLAEE